MRFTEKLRRSRLTIRYCFDAALLSLLLLLLSSAAASAEEVDCASIRALRTKVYLDSNGEKSTETVVSASGDNIVSRISIKSGSRAGQFSDQIAVMHLSKDGKRAVRVEFFSEDNPNRKSVTKYNGDGLFLCGEIAQKLENSIETDSGVIKSVLVFLGSENIVVMSKVEKAFKFEERLEVRSQGGSTISMTELYETSRYGHVRSESRTSLPCFDKQTRTIKMCENKYLRELIALE